MSDHSIPFSPYLFSKAYLYYKLSISHLLNGSVFGISILNPIFAINLLEKIDDEAIEI
jgi:hypothetical protein